MVGSAIGPDARRGAAGTGLTDADRTGAEIGIATGAAGIAGFGRATLSRGGR